VSKPEAVAVEAEAAVPTATERTLLLPEMLLTLIRREIWEHRVLWAAPLSVSLLVVLSSLLSSPGVLNFNFSFGQGASLSGVLGSGGRLPIALFGLGHWALSLPMYATLALVLTFYLNDCLFAERRDRSILFWKSLPVSDLTTVASKALVGLVLVPAGVYVLAVVTDLLFSGIWYLRAYLGTPSPLLLPWNMVVWLKVQALLGIGMVISVLWLAPLGAYLLVVSAWARRNAFLWAALPPVIAPLVEREALGTSYLWDLLSYRTYGMLEMPALAAAAASATIPLQRLSLISPAEMYDALPVWRLFTNVDLWLGIVAALALGYLAARIRRHRDDS
jgi:ABC-2 type transport system permease protein